MSSLRLAVVPLRIVLVLTFLALLVGQVFSIPGARTSGPDGKPVDWWLIALVEVGVLCVQVVVVCTWRLLSMVQAGSVFTPRAIRWVDAIICAVGVAWLMLASLFVYTASRADDPGAPMALLFILLPATAFALLLIVMRALLLQATTLQTDMDAVL